jgi:hypothetical protein
MTENAEILLLADAADIGAVTLKAGVTLDGAGYTISGNSSIKMSAVGTSTVKNVGKR